MTTIAHNPSTRFVPDAHVLAMAHAVLADTQRLCNEVWIAHPVLSTLDPSWLAIMRSHAITCCEQTNAYEIGAISDEQLAIAMHLLSVLMEQMQPALEAYIRLRIEYTDALLDALVQSKPTLAHLMSQRATETLDALTKDPMQSIDLVQSCLTRFTMLMEMAENLLMAAEECEHV